jgi:hypothetical protein
MNMAQKPALKLEITGPVVVLVAVAAYDCAASGCRLGFKRCGFNLHLGKYSEGCITFDKNDPAAQWAFDIISNLFSADAPSNTVTVIPNMPKQSGEPQP